MHFKTLMLLTTAASLVLAACSNLPVSISTPTVLFFTATLPPSPSPEPTQTAQAPTPRATLPPVEGTTTTQLNVRSEPSTAGETLGILDPFAKVQILGGDAAGNWYQIVYPAAPEGRGWVTARYVQVPEGTEISSLEEPQEGQAGPAGVVTQQVNVRSGPGTSFDSVGMLNPQDSVVLTGKNPEGTWLRIAYSRGPEGQGWIAASFVQSNGMAELPIINEQGQVKGTGTPQAAQAVPTATARPAFDDRDSASSPAASISFSPSGAGSLQFSSDISAPEGDLEDWVAFVPYTDGVSIRLGCEGNGILTTELWKDGAALDNAELPGCNEEKPIHVVPGAVYLVHLRAGTASQELQYTRFVLNITTMR